MNDPRHPPGASALVAASTAAVSGALPDDATLVRMHVEAGVATVTLARPRMHNALVPELLLDLCVALETAGRRDDVRCVLLLAEGAAFSIGGDLRRYAQRMASPGLEAYAAELVGLLNQSMLTLLRLPQPVVAGVHGRVSGGALGLVLASDVVIAADDLRFESHYASAGLSPEGGWTALLPRLAGTRRAVAGLLLDQPIEAAQALDWGLVTQLAPAADVPARALAAAQTICASPVATMRNAKRLAWGELASLEAALEAERLRFIETIGSGDARAGIRRSLAAVTGYPDDAPGRVRADGR